MENLHKEQGSEGLHTCATNPNIYDAPADCCNEEHNDAPVGADHREIAHKAECQALVPGDTDFFQDP